MRLICRVSDSHVRGKDGQRLVAMGKHLIEGMPCACMGMHATCSDTNFVRSFRFFELPT